MYLCTFLSSSRELLSGLVFFSGISLFSFFFFCFFSCVNAIVCAHHLERVLLELISSQQRWGKKKGIEVKKEKGSRAATAYEVTSSERIH